MVLQVSWSSNDPPEKNQICTLQLAAQFGIPESLPIISVSFSFLFLCKLPVASGDTVVEYFLSAGCYRLMIAFVSSSLLFPLAAL